MFVTLVVAVAILLFPRMGRLRRRHSGREVDEEKFYSSLQAELRSGSSLRHAIIAAARDWPSLAAVRRAALSGRPIAEISRGLQALPVCGEQAAVAVTVAAHSGGKAAAVFGRLADRAAASAELERQRRVLTAQTRMSAALVGGLPIAWLLLGGVGRLEALISGGGAYIAVAGLAMELLGVALVWKLASA